MTADSAAILESPADSAPPAESEGSVRPMLEALISLAMAVILVRAFAVEGYMISTGSMAPTLPGFHKRATCPKCGIEFAIGTSDDVGSTPAVAKAAFNGGESIVSRSQADSLPSGAHAVCPNCGFTRVDISQIPQSQGDQLLVFKNAYAFQLPRRWEVVVFRNPAEPMQAYVKRVVALPGEAIELKEGDVWINGKRIRKTLRQQQAVGILVYDHNFEPTDDKTWQPRWQPTDSQTTGWQRDGSAFVFDPTKNPGVKKADWVEYRHWLRIGGRHRTTMKIPAELKRFNFRENSLFPIQYDAEKSEIWTRGVLTDALHDNASRVFSDPSFKRFLKKFAAATHLSPIVDDYGYNFRNPQRPPIVVRDLMLCCDVEFRGGAGAFNLELTDGNQHYRLSIDSVSRLVTLSNPGESKPLRSVKLKADVLSEPLQLTLSLFDRQVIAAINGHSIFKPLILESLPDNVEAPRRPVRFGSRGAGLRVSNLKLYRDIFYTKKGTQGEYELGDDEYYVLGDNSPISADSRVWPHSGVSRRLFLGKPFLVHLPSKPGNFTLFGHELRVRIPDFSRIRYIR